MQLGLISPINPVSYGICGKYLFDQLQPEFYFPIGNVDVGSFSANKQEIDQMLLLIRESIDRAKEAWNRNIPALRLWHEHDISSIFHVSKKFNGLFTIFEVNKFSNNRLNVLKSQDLVFVPSKWAVEICEKNNIHAVAAPLGVDRRIFYPNQQLKSPKFTVVTAGKWELRKNTQKIIMAFFKAMQNEDAQMLACVDNPFFSEEDMGKIKQAVAHEIHTQYPNKKATLTFVKRLRTLQEMASLYNRAHLGVQCSRAEGFDLPCLEMLSCGIHLLASNNSGHTEFLNRANSTFLSKQVECIMRDNLWFNAEGGTTWFDSDENEIADQIREIYKSGKWQFLNEEGIRTAEKFSWGNCSRILEKNIPKN